MSRFFVCLLAVTFVSLVYCGSTCPFSNVAVVIFASSADFPMMYFALTTLSRFMPCSNKVHLLIDRHDIPSSVLWFAENMGSHNINLHSFEAPSNVNYFASMMDNKQKSELSHRWGRFWADKYADDSTVDYIMLLDVNTIFAMPMSCKSLFDEKGRPHHVGVPMDSFPTIQTTCRQWTGSAACDRSYASVAPFLMPRQAFEPLREHVRKTLDSSASSFDAAVDSWLRNNVWETLSPLQIMGEFMRQQHPAQVHQIMCPAWPVNFQTAEEDVKACEQFVPPAVYYDRPVQELLKLDKDAEFQAATYRAVDTDKFQAVLGANFAVPTLPLMEMIVDQGDCIGIYMYRGEVSEDEGCSETTAKSIHKMLDLYYGKRALSWRKVEEVYAKPTNSKICSETNRQWS